MGQNSETKVPRLTLREGDLLARLLREAQRLLLRHPQGAAAIVRALVAEGRRFAQTEEGRAWQEQLAGSDLIKKGHLIWQAHALDAVANGGPATVPTQWLEMTLGALTEADVEQVLAKLMVEASTDETTFDPL